MTTETYEVLSLEEGDTLYINGSLFAIVSIDIDGDDTVLLLADEEGFMKKVWCQDTDRFRVVCDA